MGLPADPKRSKILIGVVGVCASGKSTLIEGLTDRGYTARHIAQEHSYVKDMWQRITHPDLLIFLDVSFEEAQKRRTLDWNEQDYQEQHHRLAHARVHADLRLDTTPLTTNEVLEQVISFIEAWQSRTGSAK